MNSYDIFDTLIGRWYIRPDSIFEEIEKETQLPNFVWMRKHAENIAIEKTFDGIYREFQKLAGISDSAVELIKEAEFDLECRMTFPIMENMMRVKTEDVLISDTYFNKEQLAAILDCNGFPQSYYRDIICSYDGKSSGRVWSQIKPDLHVGDNNKSDVIIPQQHGIKTELYTGHMNTGLEAELYDRGWTGLSMFSRLCRLTNPETSEQNIAIWNEQAEKNIPTLTLLSLYLNSYLGLYTRFLFTQRDCVHLEKFFRQLFPNVDSRKFYTSRALYENPTDNFKEYVKRTYTTNSLIIDMQGTGISCYRFFESMQLPKPNYFTIVYSDMGELYKPRHIAFRGNGFTDVIERLNYDNIGKTIDIDLDLDYPIRDNFAPVPAIEVQHKAIDNALFYLKRGFDVFRTQDKNTLNLLTDTILELLYKMEWNCEICKQVNHEAI